MNGVELGAALAGAAAFVTAAAGAWATIRQANRSAVHDAELEARIRRLVEARREDSDDRR